MIKPIPLYLDHDDIIKLRAYLNSIDIRDLEDEAVLILSQNADLDQIYLSIWCEGQCNDQLTIS